MAKWETAPRRAWNDTKDWVIGNNFKTWLIVAIILSVLTPMLTAYLTPVNTSRLVNGVFGFVGAILALLLTVAIVYLYRLMITPYRQRNDARKMVDQLEKPSGSEVSEAIHLLQADKLILRHNSGDERSYSFAQVLLAIAERLSIGVSLINFESRIMEGLQIDAKESWYFPSERKGIIRLIAALDQNAIIERHNQEYSRMVTNYPFALTGVFEAGQHLEKGTEVVYYLSPFGSRVVQQLRKQRG